MSSFVRASTIDNSFQIHVEGRSEIKNIVSKVSDLLTKVATIDAQEGESNDEWVSHTFALTPLVDLRTFTAELEKILDIAHELISEPVKRRRTA